MAFSKRKSRKIVVDDITYRWSPSNHNGTMVLAVQHVSGKGRKLEVSVSTDKEVIIENGNFTIEIGNNEEPMITPKLVAVTIRRALKIGWNPLVRGKVLRLF
ncbi:MAG: hypothetical protein AB8B69_13190 [Chitinophagales bacterium]